MRSARHAADREMRNAYVISVRNLKGEMNVDVGG